MKDYKYGTDKEKDKKIDKAIEKYKKTLWTIFECEKCETTIDVRYDNETLEHICGDCLTKELRDDIDGLINVGILK